MKQLSIVFYIGNFRKLKIRFLFLLLLLALGYLSNAQCDCETIYREDGKIIQCNPSMVAYDNLTQVGIALASNGEDKFITIAVRFKGSASKIIDKLHLRLTNNQLLSFDLINSGKAYIGNSNMANAIYLIKSEQVTKLVSSKLSTISFTLNDKKIHTYECRENTDVLKRQINCL